MWCAGYFHSVARASALAVVLFASGVAQAQIRTWTDQDGVMHVDDAPSRRASSARKSDPRQPSWRAPNAAPRKLPAAPKAKARRPPRWWERRTDAPPDEVDKAARQFNIPAELIRAVIAAESDGDASAVSRKGALGLMQLMPRTAGEMYVQDPVDPAQNVMGGTRYLRFLANQFSGDMLLVLAAYNAGPEAVRRYRGVPPFAETREYVRRVMRYYFELKRSAGRLADARGPAGGAP